jgi:hypothetical protein
MRQNEPDIDNSVLIFDSGDKPVLIARDVENGAIAHRIGVRIIQPYISEVFPSSFQSPPIPVIERLCGIRVFAAEFEQRLSAYHPHTEMFS